MQKRDMLASVSVVFGLMGCGDDSAESAGARDQAPVICARVCERASAPNCLNEKSDCESQCADVLGGSPVACDDQLDAFANCQLRSTFTCDADGEANAVACSALQDAWTSCYVNNGGRPNGNGNVADGGVGQTPGNNDAGSQTPGNNDAGSQTPGNNDAGSQTPGNLGSDAGTQKPDAGAPRNDGGTLPANQGDAGTLPGGELLCQPEAEDDACDTCIKSQCCEQAVLCGAACQQLTACLMQCQTQDCLQACYDAYPAGAAAFDALSECLLDSCEISCADEPEPVLEG